MRWSRRVIWMVLLACCGAAGAQTAAIFNSKVQTLPAKDLQAALRGGGNVIYFRHAATVVGADQNTTDFDDCSTQRNLSDEGRADARAVGVAFERLSIRVGDVLASPYCRTMDTARLAFGRATRSMELFSRGAAKLPDELARVEWLRAAFGKAPPAGLNTVLVSHGSPLEAVTGEFMREGECVVARPTGDGGFRLIARLTPAQWTELAALSP